MSRCSFLLLFRHSLPSPFFDAHREIFFTSPTSQCIEKQTRPTAEADLSLPVMLWCIIPKWMVNGLCNLYGVKAFFLEIVAGIRRHPSRVRHSLVRGDGHDVQNENYNADDNWQSILMNFPSSTRSFLNLTRQLNIIKMIFYNISILN